MTIRISHKVRRPLRLRGMPPILGASSGLMWRCSCRDPFITYCSLAFVSGAGSSPIASPLPLCGMSWMRNDIAGLEGPHSVLFVVFQC